MSKTDFQSQFTELIKYYPIVSQGGIFGTYNNNEELVHKIFCGCNNCHQKRLQDKDGVFVDRQIDAGWRNVRSVLDSDIPYNDKFAFWIREGLDPSTVYHHPNRGDRHTVIPSDSRNFGAYNQAVYRHQLEFETTLFNEISLGQLVKDFETRMSRALYPEQLVEKNKADLHTRMENHRNKNIRTTFEDLVSGGELNWREKPWEYIECAEKVVAHEAYLFLHYLESYPKVEVSPCFVAYAGELLGGDQSGVAWSEIADFFLAKSKDYHIDLPIVDAEFPIDGSIYSKRDGFIQCVGAFPADLHLALLTEFAAVVGKEDSQIFIGRLKTIRAPTGPRNRKLSELDKWEPGRSATTKNRFIMDKTNIQLSGTSRRILRFLYKQSELRPPVPGIISMRTGISMDEIRSEGDKLEGYDLIERSDGKVEITQVGKTWLEKDNEGQEDRIREFVYTDYDFALLRFLSEQDCPIPMDEMPQVLVDEAPRTTNGYPEMNLLQKLQIELNRYIIEENQKYSLSRGGQKYFEHLLKGKGNNHNSTAIHEGRKTKTRIFISYAHADKEWLVVLKDHLKALAHVSQDEIEEWNDTTNLLTGDVFEHEIEKAIGEADIAIFLVSTKFLGSKFIRYKELAPLLEKAERQGTLLMPVIISPCLFSESLLRNYQAVNDPQQPLCDMSPSDQEKEFLKLCRHILMQLDRKRQER